MERIDRRRNVWMNFTSLDFSKFTLQHETTLRNLHGNVQQKILIRHAAIRWMFLLYRCQTQRLSRLRLTRYIKYYSVWLATPTWTKRVTCMQWGVAVQSVSWVVVQWKTVVWYHIGDTKVIFKTEKEWVSELVYLTSLLNSQGLMSDGPVAGQWDEGWKGPRHEYTGFRTRDPVVWSRVFYRSTKRTAHIIKCFVDKFLFQ